MSGILGISSEIHDSCISVVSRDGKIKLAVNEERFTRRKKEGRYPFDSLDYKNHLSLEHQLTAVPLQTKEDCIKSHKMAGVNLPSDEEYLKRINFFDEDDKPKVHVGHHASHAASTYFTSGFEDAIIITMDGGSMFEPWCTTIYEGKGSVLKTIREDTSCFTQNYFFTTALLGFTPNKHEGKITGLAAYGRLNNEIFDFFEEHSDISKSLAHQIADWENLGEKAKTPTMRLNFDLINTYREKFSHIRPEDIAYTVQHFTELKVLDFIVSNVSNIEDSRITLAGGLFANVIINQKIKKLGFKEIFIHPGMGDEGLALGAVLHFLGKENNLKPFRLTNVFFGPEYSNQTIKEALEESGLKYETPSDISNTIAQILTQGKVVARYVGRMEYGPRALGNRSILYQTTDKTVNDWLNRRLKRTEFMPFAPATLEEFAEDCYHDFKGTEYTSQFMTITFGCTDKMKSESPAVVHIDGTARPQIVNGQSNPQFYRILKEYHKLTGIPSVINTSFNNHGEPIVCSPRDAIKSFIHGNLDYLAIGDYLVKNKK